MTTIISPTVPTSRAVQRRVAPGSSVTCASCDTLVKFAARQNRRQIIANVYVDGRWNRVEHFHAECYETVGEPYGDPGEPLNNARTRSA